METIKQEILELYDEKNRESHMVYVLENNGHVYLTKGGELFGRRSCFTQFPSLDIDLGLEDGYIILPQHLSHEEIEELHRRLSTTIKEEFDSSFMMETPEGNYDEYGKRHGIWRSVDNGRLTFIGKYDHGRPIGAWKWFRNDGTFLMKKEWV